MIKGNLEYYLTPLLCSISVAIIYMFLMSPSITSNPLVSAYAQLGDGQPTINATNVFDTGQMILPSNVKHLVILIPNEGHHGPGEADEARYIDQPFVPQNAVVSPGTEVIWYNGDVGHEHNIVVTNADGSGPDTSLTSLVANGTELFNSGEFTELEASTPYTFSQQGEYNYADTVDYEEGFRMTGKITVADHQQDIVATNSTVADTVGALMVPAEDSQDIAQMLRIAGLDIDSMATFQDLRTAGEDEGDQQTLLIWTTNGKDMNEIASTLQQISEELPYG